MLKRVKKYFFSGLAVFLPLLLTIYVCIWALNFAENIFGRYLRPFLLENYDFYIWGVGIAVLLTLILACGFMITHYFGRVAHRYTENLMMRIPLMASIYPAFKEIAQFLFREEGKAHPQQVVLIEWPNAGSYTIGFLTNNTTKRVADKVGLDLVNVLVPTVPNPLTGFVVLIPREKVTRLDMSVEQAVKFVVSGGVVDPYALPSNEALS